MLNNGAAATNREHLVHINVFFVVYFRLRCVQRFDRGDCRTRQGNVPIDVELGEQALPALSR
jgi:hypothetical protein